MDVHVRSMFLVVVLVVMTLYGDAFSGTEIGKDVPSDLSLHQVQSIPPDAEGRDTLSPLSGVPHGKAEAAASTFNLDDEILLLSLFEEAERSQGPAAGEGMVVAAAGDRQADTVVENGSVATAENGGEDVDNNRIADPLYYWNLSMYHFNDRLYFWFMKPVAQGYKAVTPEGVRIAVSNFFQNVTTPIRFVGNLLQFRLKNAGNELVRFITNSTQGLGGFMDVAKSHYGIEGHDEDIGQALGSYGIGHGFYVVWPFFGPSSLRDSIGLAGDTLLNPVTYINPLETSVGLRVYDRVNEKTFHIGDYESMKESAIDPYVSLRNAYLQYRKKQVRE